MWYKWILETLLGASVGTALGAAAMNIVAMIRNHDVRGHLGYIMSKFGWTLVMVPLIAAIQKAPVLEATGLYWIFSVGVGVAAVGFLITARAERHGIRTLALYARLLDVENKLKKQGLRI